MSGATHSDVGLRHLQLSTHGGEGDCDAAEPAPSPRLRGEGRGGGSALSARARANRRQPTEPERRLWAALRGHRLGGVQFSRQVPVAGFILDFAARRERIGIEVDGHTHGDAGAEAHRTAAVERAGYRLIRFQNREVMENLPGVLVAIAAALAPFRTSPPPRPSPRKRGEGEDASLVKSCPRAGGEGDDFCRSPSIAQDGKES